MATAHSIRDFLQGATHDFVLESGFANNSNIENLVREFVPLLAAYREEEKPLFPDVFMFGSENAMKAISPSGLRFRIGNRAYSTTLAQDILKDSATLAIRGWAIYVVHTELGAEYGIFRSRTHSIAIPAEESLRDLGIEEPVILIRNQGHLIVELTNSISGVHTVALTTHRAQPSPVRDAIVSLSRAISAHPTVADGFEAYLSRLLINILRQCHGTLLAVAKTNGSEELDPTLSDGVRLNPPLDLASLYESATSAMTAVALAELEAGETAVEGMIASDGVVVFDGCGRVLAYRVFLRANEDERAFVPDKGGGRRRTFELMKRRIGTTLDAALFRSQDGEVCCERQAL